MAPIRILIIGFFVAVFPVFPMINNETDDNALLREEGNGVWFLPGSIQFSGVDAVLEGLMTFFAGSPIHESAQGDKEVVSSPVRGRNSDNAYSAMSYEELKKEEAKTVTRMRLIVAQRKPLYYEDHCVGGTFTDNDRKTFDDLYRKIYSLITTMPVYSPSDQSATDSVIAELTRLRRAIDKSRAKDKCPGLERLVISGDMTRYSPW